jgi:hypothetical protein
MYSNFKQYSFTLNFIYPNYIKLFKLSFILKTYQFLLFNVKNL